ncbi:GL22824 [Drosophila persimilis]|uniref:GL22824 n=1 Tax=Drosophila persimilis TaxID=7234 RepID=B4GZJ0_DROPE|nr:GL22824 [Drosophila persimilis]
MAEFLESPERTVKELAAEADKLCQGDAGRVEVVVPSTHVYREPPGINYVYATTPPQRRGWSLRRAVTEGDGGGSRADKLLNYHEWQDRSGSCVLIKCQNNCGLHPIRDPIRGSGQAVSLEAAELQMRPGVSFELKQRQM